MLGAIIGDIVGSTRERHNIKTENFANDKPPTTVAPIVQTSHRAAIQPKHPLVSLIL